MGGEDDLGRLLDRAAGGSGDIADGRFDQRHRWMYRLNRLGVLDRFGVAEAFPPLTIGADDRR